MPNWRENAHDLKIEMHRVMEHGGLWFGIKAAFLLTLSAILVIAVLLMIQGEPPTRRAAAGLVVLPPVMVFYILRFRYVEYSRRSVAAHLGTVLCAGVIGLSVYVHNVYPAHVKGVNFTLLLCSIVVALFGFGICLICVLSCSGYGRHSKVRSSHGERGRSKYD